MGVVDGQSCIEGGELRIDRGVGAESEARPWALPDHLQCGAEDLAAVEKWILLLKAIPKRLAAGYRDGEPSDGDGHSDQLAGATPGPSQKRQSQDFRRDPLSAAPGVARNYPSVDNTSPGHLKPDPAAIAARRLWRQLR